MEPHSHSTRRLSIQLSAAGLALTCTLNFTVAAQADSTVNELSGLATTSTAQRSRLLPGQAARNHSAVISAKDASTSEVTNETTDQEGICGNARLDPGEQCDDGDTLGGDGCSQGCTIENGWTCTVPIASEEFIGDGGLELGTPHPYWEESSTNFDTPICNELDCGLGVGSGPASGDWWAWFGGIATFEESSLVQTITIPVSAEELTFQLEVSYCDSADDYLEVRIGFVRRWVIDGSSELCGSQGYTLQTVNIADFADGELHRVEFHSRTFGNNGDVTNFFVDNIALRSGPSVCSPIDPATVVLRDGFESQ